MTLQVGSKGAAMVLDFGKGQTLAQRAEGRFVGVALTGVCDHRGQIGGAG
ncbi:hypothetical protein GCM10023333_07040 [Ferrimonas pelagia]|uniref:Uncharacterized protein n=1 Tax=Ferrimonas pelagia TaxID=1177826 RepID=A0ABP9EEC4_9GAMM